MIQGMETVVVTVSGYHGNERFNLIKLIDYTGANYVGPMSSSVTHLVCWRFEGRKFEIGMKSRTVVVNHRWIEDCLKLGKRVPEGPYTFQSGEEVGPLALDAPWVSNVLAEKTNTLYGSESHGNVGFEAFNEFQSSSLNEEFLPSTSKCGSALRSFKRKLVKQSSKKEPCTSSRRSLQEPPLSRSNRNTKREESCSRARPIELSRDKRKRTNSYRSTIPESSCKGRRGLSKMNKIRDIVELLTSDSDSDQDFFPSRVDAAATAVDEDVVFLSDDIDQTPCRSALQNLQTECLKPDSSCSRSLSMDNDVFTDNTLITTGKVSEECPGANSLNEETAKELENDAEIPSSAESSCVICLTDFSLTRGVLPCGHRFCYSCIESWADHMASRRKISTCPLCKTRFGSILKLEGGDGVTFDQKIYSQTVPCGLSKMDMSFLYDDEIANISSQSESGPVCSVCRFMEPEDLLVACNLCRIRRIHSYCLDPPVHPWICFDCKDLQRLYLNR